VKRGIDVCPWSCFVSAVVSGTARGADKFGESWASKHHVRIIRLPAEWEKHGKKAGPIRNREMASIAHGLIAVWDGKSAGTRNMIEEARALSLRIAIFRTDLRELVEVAPSGTLADLWADAEERAAHKQFMAGMERGAAERDAGREVSAMHELPARFMTTPRPRS
jgi:hypothetical protein